MVLRGEKTAAKEISASVYRQRLRRDAHADY